MTKFVHRIDAVPDAGRKIVYTDHSGTERGAVVAEASPVEAYGGIGDDRRLIAADGKRWQPSRVMVTWRYDD